MIDQQLLQKYTNAFILYEIANHGVDPRETLERTTLRIKTAEGYKYDVYDKYHSILKSGRPYYDKIMNALPGGNLVDRFQKSRIEILADKDGKAPIENALNILYSEDNDEEAFTEIVKVLGGSFDVVGFCFFLKDFNKYLPIRSRNFDDRLGRLGIESNLEGHCTWDKYNVFIDYVREIQDFLIGHLNKEITLLDAHSFLWIIDKLEEYIGSNSQIIIHNRFGKGIVSGFEDDLIIVKFGKTIRKFSKDIVFDNNILQYDSSPLDLYEFGSDKELEKTVTERAKTTNDITQELVASKSREKAKQDKRDKDYPSDNKYESDISKEAWMDMIQDENIFYDKDIDFLKRIYSEDNHASTCYDLSVQEGIHPSSYISPMVSLAKRIVKRQNITPVILDNGKESWWQVIFGGRNREDGLFEWKLQPELALAIEELYPDLDVKLVNEELDEKLNSDLKTASLKEVEEGFEYRGKPKEKSAAIVVKGHSAYPRDRKVAVNALSHADFKCEIDNDHYTFVRRNSDKTYTEPHHLVPLAFADLFDVSLDVEENIVSLCSNCHNEIHYGRDADILIEKLYDLRKNELKSVGIVISLEDLLKMYR